MDLLTGAIDLHVHTAPDVYERRVTDVECAQQASTEGMRAVLLKSHHTLTADRATLARAAEHIDCAVYGGLALNHTVGGLNPIAVETALEFGAKQIWMPTIHAAHCLDTAEQPIFRAEAARGRPGLSVINEAGQLRTDPLDPILEMIRDAGAILGTGHLAPMESLILIRHARAMGLERILVTHPLMSFTRFTIEQMYAAAAMGAVLEFDFLSCSPNWPGAIDPAENAGAIREIGPRHCVMATDGGQAYNPEPTVMLRDFAESMRSNGIDETDLRLMMCDNPARLLGL